jgi:cytochrome c-type biogenesis protein
MIAFLAGMLSILAPCSLPVLMGYMAAISKQKCGFWPKTAAFFAGLAVVWILLGILASTLGAAVAKNWPALYQIAGIVMIAFGLMHLLGISMPSLRISKKVDISLLGMFAFGLLFTFVWIPCSGPVLAGILAIAATMRVMEGGLLLLLYAAGFMLSVVTVFLVAQRSGRKITGRKTVKIFDRRLLLSNMLTGAFLIIIGLIYALNWVGAVSGLATPVTGAVLDLETGMLQNPVPASIAAIVIIIAAAVLAWRR